MRMRRVFVGFFLIACWAGRAGAATPPALYAFGDSLSDAGNVYALTAGIAPLSPPYSNGRFSNGPVWVQDLSNAFGLGRLTASVYGGGDFAYGGAQSGQTLVHAPSPLDLPTQLAQFALQVPHPRPGALYTVWIGSNDLLTVLGQPSLSADQVAQAERQILNNTANFVAGLVVLGARDVLLLTVPDLGKTPSVATGGPAAAAAATALAADYNARLTPYMAALASYFGVSVRVVDTFALLDGAVADPALYGFANVTSPCWTGSLTKIDGTLCSYVGTVQNTYLFWDGLHPTAQAHALIAGAAQSALGAAAAPAAR